MCHRIHCILLNYAAILRDTIYSGPEDPGPGDQWTRGLGTRGPKDLRGPVDPGTGDPGTQGSSAVTGDRNAITSISVLM